MAKLILVSFVAIVIICCFMVTTTNASTYVVGDTSGWDISTNLNSWTSDKTFQVGDVLMFQYSSSDSVCEVTRKNFQTCNTTSVVSRFSTGNTNVTLTKPGTRYFVDGNQLYCLGGLKLLVNVGGDDATASSAPVAAPQAQPESVAAFPAPNSKNENPVSVSYGGVVLEGWMSSLVMVFMVLMCIEF